MIKTKIYFVQQRKYYGHDKTDDEDIEECLIIGYFSSLAIVEKVKALCIKNGISESDIDIKSFDIIFKNCQKYVYVLSHVYSKQETDGSFTDYEYIFAPQSCKDACNRLKEKLANTTKFMHSDIRDYSINPPDGFNIEKYEIDQLVYPINEKIS